MYSTFSKLKGGALYLAIMISISVSVVLLMFLVLSDFTQRDINSYILQDRLRHTLNNGVAWGTSASFPLSSSGVWTKSVLSDDSLRIVKYMWGAYEIVNCEAKNKRFKISTSGLYGTCMQQDTSLLLCEYARPLSFSGQNSFASKCFLPRAGLHPAFDGGQAPSVRFKKGSAPRGAPASIPSVAADFIAALRSQFVILPTDSLCSLTDSLNNPFRARTATIQTDKIHAAKVALKSNVKLLCNEFVADSTSRLENILVVCNKARFENGFKGVLHVLASDSIIIGKNCEFEYPSSLTILPKAGTSYAKVWFEENSRFSGTILALRDFSSNRQKVIIKTARTSEISGMVYSADFIQLQGLLYASVIADRLVSTAGGSTTQDVFGHCTVDPGKYGAILSVANCFLNRQQLLQAKKLE